MNNLISVITGDTAVQYWYDTAGRKTAMATGLSSVKPNGGIPSTGSVTKYEYGMRSYLTKETDALNQSVTYTHDYNGNVKTLTDR